MKMFKFSMLDLPPNPNTYVSCWKCHTRAKIGDVYFTAPFDGFYFCEPCAALYVLETL